MKANPPPEPAHSTESLLGAALKAAGAVGAIRLRAFELWALSLTGMVEFILCDV